MKQNLEFNFIALSVEKGRNGVLGEYLVNVFNWYFLNPVTIQDTMDALVVQVQEVQHPEPEERILVRNYQDLLTIQTLLLHQLLVPPKGPRPSLQTRLTYILLGGIGGVVQ